MFCFTLFVFESFLPLIGAQTRSTPIDVNLIIDSSESLPGVKEEITTWISNNFVDQILAEGDNFAVWSAGSKAKVIFSGTIKGNSAKEDVKKSIHEIASAGKTADFSSALKEAALRCQNSPFSYTLLISASPASLEQVLSGGHASLMRYSKVEEFSGWRALVVGLNLDEKVGRAAAAYIGS
ncbi:MAG: VWA domain-containing protein [Treponema sp.]|nr:VWA domain-containing protein [Treponema sp.]